MRAATEVAATATVEARTLGRMKTIKLRTIPDPGKSRATFVGFPASEEGEGAFTLTCGKCDEVLAREIVGLSHLKGPNDTAIVLQCKKCRAYNETSGVKFE